MTDRRKARRCPHCGSARVAEIVYGLLAPNFWEHHDKEAVVLGGCEITGSDPQWRCRECGAEWGEERGGDVF